jgi:hypothetical protein
MKIRNNYEPKPTPTRNCDWSAIDEHTYDGAPDSKTRREIGWGATAQEAVADLLRLLGDGRE